MVKQKVNSVNPPSGAGSRKDDGGGPQEPLSGSKTVKNRNHSRHNHGEGH